MAEGMVRPTRFLRELARFPLHRRRFVIAFVPTAHRGGPIGQSFGIRISEVGVSRFEHLVMFMHPDRIGIL